MFLFYITFQKQNQSIMPGTHPKAKKRCYDNDQLQRALEAVREGTSILAASKSYSIPYSTLRDKVVGKSKPILQQRGVECVLGDDVEKPLVEGLVELGSIGFGKTMPELMDLVKSYLDKCGEDIVQFQNNRPGKTWCYAFMRRHPELKKQRARGLENVRAMSCTEDSIRLWISEFARTIEEHGINSPSQVPYLYFMHLGKVKVGRLWNIDGVKY